MQRGNIVYQVGNELYLVSGVKWGGGRVYRSANDENCAGALGRRAERASSPATTVLPTCSPGKTIFEIFLTLFVFLGYTSVEKVNVLFFK